MSSLQILNLSSQIRSNPVAFFILTFFIWMHIFARSSHHGLLLSFNHFLQTLNATSASISIHLFSSIDIDQASSMLTSFQNISFLTISNDPCLIFCHFRRYYPMTYTQNAIFVALSEMISRKIVTIIFYIL